MSEAPDPEDPLAQAHDAGAEDQDYTEDDEYLEDSEAARGPRILGPALRTLRRVFRNLFAAISAGFQGHVLIC